MFPDETVGVLSHLNDSLTLYFYDTLMLWFYESFCSFYESMTPRFRDVIDLKVLVFGFCSNE